MKLIRILGIFLALPIVVVAGAFAFDSGMKVTSNQEFCISCHEMQAYSYREFLETPHAKNHVGYEVSCADCHVPQPFVEKIKRKVVASREVWYHLRGELDSPEKYEANRQRMAERVWAEMQANDSAACRSCHDVDRMTAPQTLVKRHRTALEQGHTCIDCHQGLAHRLP